jgi:hypothetical protein
MPDKEKKPDFVVTDRRLFSSEGELRQDVVEDEERRAERERENREAQQRRNDERAAEKQAAPAPTSTSVEDAPEMETPSAQEQQASAAAYEESARDIDARIAQEMHKQGRQHSAQDYEVTFEKFIASIYMTALMQLGLAAPPGEKPGVDLIGARHTIDTVAMLQEKTKGNLSAADDRMLQNILYELRMAYLEVTNLITNPPQPGAAPDRKR